MTAHTITAATVRTMITTVIEDIIRDYSNQPETDRETLIDRLDEENDTLFGALVRTQLVSTYTVHDLVATVQPCDVIIQVATEDAWIEDDRGLWEGLTYGILATVAFFSLRNCLYEGLKRRGIDTNTDRPFAAA